MRFLLCHDHDGSHMHYAVSRSHPVTAIAADDLAEAHPQVDGVRVKARPVVVHGDGPTPLVTVEVDDHLMRWAPVGRSAARW